MSFPATFLRKNTLKYPPHINLDDHIEHKMLEFLLQPQDSTPGYTYLPIQWTAYYIAHNWGNHDQELEGYLNRLRPDLKFFTVVQWDRGIQSKRNMAIFSSGGGTGENAYFEENRINITPIPLLFTPHTVTPTKPVYLCSFVGRENHPIRKKMHDILHKEPDFKFIMDVSNTNPSIKVFEDAVSQSTFCLCPRGYGRSSARLYECMQMGSIPIYLTDSPSEFWLPCTDEISWTDFSILLTSKQIAELPSILRALSTDQIAKYRENLAAVVKSHFNFDALCRYIVRVINNSHERNISVAIPYYNSSRYIDRLVATFLDDHRINEIVIVDDCSQITEYQYLERYRGVEKIKVFRNEQNKGGLINKYTTVKKCKNQWVILMDSDNYPLPGYVDAVYRMMVWNHQYYYVPSNPMFDGVKDWDYMRWCRLSPRYSVLDMDKVTEIYRKNYAESVKCNRVGQEIYPWGGLNGLLNTGNFFINRDQYTTIFEKYNISKHALDDTRSADVVCFSYYWLLNGNCIQVLDGCRYFHTTRNDSFSATHPGNSRKWDKLFLDHAV